MSTVFLKMYSTVPWLTVGVLAAIMPFVIMTGMHYALIPMMFNNLATLGFDVLVLVTQYCSNIAQGGAAFGAAFKTKNEEVRSEGIACGISATIAGVTEPAMYGVNLKYKRPFICAMISSAVAAAFLFFFHAGAIAYAPPGLFTIITYQADSFAFVVIGAAMAFGIAAVLSFFFGVPKEENITEDISAKPAVSEKTSGKEISINAPVTGRVIPLSQIPDAAFAEGAMGKGVGIEPHEGKVYAPFEGDVEMLFDTKHAIGLVSEQGVNVLIHVGLDTVELNGQYFTAHVNTGDHVQKGQLLIEFDMDKIAENYSLITPVLVTNTEDYASVEGMSGMIADRETRIIRIK